jgi:hydroxypyruvate reductase
MTPEHALRRDAEAIWRAGVEAVSPHRLMPAIDWSAWLGHALPSFGRVEVLAVGKAAFAMAGALVAVADRPLGGAVTVPAGYVASSHRLPRFARFDAGHPQPTAGSVAAGQDALERAARLSAGDLLVVLISGGASALWTVPAQGVTLAEITHVNRRLLASGEPIHRVNTVRKHLTRLGGGGLAQATQARVATLALSDVIGDDAAVIGSGPTAPDATTWTDVRHVLDDVGWDTLPASVRQIVAWGEAGTIGETLRLADAAAHRSRVRIVGSIRDALEGAARQARRRGYRVRVVTDRRQGEARRVGHEMARELAREGPGACLLWGGETTVTLSGDGKGGRNQEVALGALRHMPRDGVLLAAGTDGIDGPTDAAGAFAAGAKRDAAGVETALARNDAYSFFDRHDALFRPGPTGSNVMDLTVGVRCSGRS